MTRAVPNIFGPLTNPTLPNLDQDFAAVAPCIVIPCTAAGTNSLVLTPVSGTLSVSAYTDQEQFSFAAPATTTGPVTVNIGGVGALNLNLPGSTVQAAGGSLAAGNFYQIVYQSARNAFALVSTPSTVAALSRTTTITSVSGTAVETAFANYAMPGNVIGTNSVVTMYSRAALRNTTGNIQTVTFTARYGTELLLQTGPISVTGTSGSSVQGMITLSGNGATNAQVGMAQLIFVASTDVSGGSVASTIRTGYNDLLNVDSTILQNLQFNVTFGSAQGQLEIRNYATWVNQQ